MEFDVATRKLAAAPHTGLPCTRAFCGVGPKRERERVEDLHQHRVADEGDALPPEQLARGLAVECGQPARRHWCPLVGIGSRWPVDFRARLPRRELKLWRPVANVRYILIECHVVAWARSRRHPMAVRKTFWEAAREGD